MSDSVAGAVSRLEAMPDGVREHAEQGLAQALLTPTTAFSRGDIELVLDWHSTFVERPDLAERLFEVIESEEGRRLVGFVLLERFNRIDPDPEKAAYYREQLSKL